ncbi:MAG: hypothetical protein ACKO0Z_16875 [Betaproteobacteria bacterium]
MNLLQAAYCLVAVGGFLVVAVTDPAMALFAIVGLAVIFGAYVGLEWIFGSRK